MTCSNCFFSVKKHNPHLKGNKAKYERPWPRDTDLGHRKLHVPVCLELHVVFVLTKQRELYTKAFFICMGGNSRQTGFRFNLMTFLDSGLMEAGGLLLHSRRVYLIVTRMLGQTLGVETVQ